MVMNNYDHNWYTLIEGEMYAIIFFYVEDLLLIWENLVNNLKEDLKCLN
jgi:hypothetical protein